MFVQPTKDTFRSILNTENLNLWPAERIVYLTEHALQLQDLRTNEKLMEKLYDVDGTRFNIDTAHTLMEKLVKLGWQGDLDLTYFQLMQTRQQMTFNNYH